MILHLASFAPNARVVTMFLREKGVETPIHEILPGDNRTPEFARKNPQSQFPVLEFEDGSCLSENTVICEYFEALHPEPALIGATDRERAETRMWVRRLDLNICEHAANITRFGVAHDYFKQHIFVAPDIIPALTTIVTRELGRLEAHMADGRPWICGERFSLADVMLFSHMDFRHRRVEPFDPAWTHLSAWLARAGARPSALATRPVYPR